MKKLSRSIAPLFLLGFFFVPSLSADEEIVWDLRYEAKMEPHLEGAVERIDGTHLSFQTPAKENYTVSVEENGLDFAFHGAGVFSLIPEVEEITLENNILDLSLRLESTVNRIEPPVSNASAVCIQIGETQVDDPGMYMIGFYTDVWDGKNYVILQGHDKSPPYEIGSDFHNFRVVARDGTIELYVDGAIVGMVEPRRGINQPGIHFGNARGSDHTGQSTLGYLRMKCGEAVEP